MLQDSAVALAHANISFHHWIAVARMTRIEMPEERCGHARALARAAYWRREAGILLTRRRRMALDLLTRRTT